MSPSIPGNGSHPRLQWAIRGTPTITLTEAIETAVPVNVLDNTVVDADAYYHVETDTLIVVQYGTVQTVLERDDASLRCPHGHPPENCPTCQDNPPLPSTDPFENGEHPTVPIHQ